MGRIAQTAKQLVAALLLCAAAPAQRVVPEGTLPAGTPHVYKRVDGRELKLYVVPAAGEGTRRPAIVLFHGGGWVGGTPAQFNHQAEYLASRGVTAVLVQYRLLARDTNDPPTVCVQDAKSAMRWVRGHAAELGIDPARIAAGGGSAGGHLAAFLGLMDGIDDPADDRAVSARANAMVLFNPVFDNGPGGWGAERVRDRYREFSPWHNVRAGAPPAIVFVGTQDDLLPVKTVLAFQQAMRDAGAKCEVKVYEGQKHGFFNYRDDNRYYRDTMIAADEFLASIGWLTGPPTLR